MPSRDGGGPIGQGRHKGGAVHSDLSYPDKRDCAVRQRAKDNIRNYEGISIRAYVGLAIRDLASPFLWCLLWTEASGHQIVQPCRHHHITPSVAVSNSGLSFDAMVRPYDAETLHPLHDGWRRLAAQQGCKVRAYEGETMGNQGNEITKYHIKK